MLRFGLAVILSFFTIGAMAAEAPLPVPPELIQFVQRPEQINNLQGQIMQAWPRIASACTDVRFSDYRVFPLVPFAADSTGKALSGAWRISVTVAGCGATRLMNYISSVVEPGHLRASLLLPGHTKGDITLERDGVQYARRCMVKLVPAGCTDVVVADTGAPVLGEAMPNVQAGHDPHSWAEQWTLNACGVTGQVDMQFIPDATGTTISCGEAKAAQ